MDIGELTEQSLLVLILLLILFFKSNFLQRRGHFKVLIVCFKVKSNFYFGLATLKVHPCLGTRNNKQSVAETVLSCKYSLQHV